MAKKTVLKLLLSKFGPLSVAMQMAQTFDQAVVNIDNNTLNVDEAEASYVDNDRQYTEVVPDTTESKAHADAVAAASQSFSEQKQENKDKKSNIETTLF